MMGGTAGPRARTFRELDASGDRADLERLLRVAVPHDYVLQILDRFLATGGVLGGFSGGELVAVQRLEDLGQGDGWIGAIRVRPDLRRQGWGADLTRFALESARKIGVRTVRLTIEDTNRASRALAASLGFRPIAGLAHVVGLATPRPNAPLALPLRPVSVGEAAAWDPAHLPGVLSLGGCLMGTVPRPLRFVRATRARLEQEAATGRLLLLGDHPARGLCIRASPGQSGSRDGRRFRLLCPLGSDVLGIFRAASATSRAERIEMEGFVPASPTLLPALDREGWRTGAAAFWGDRLHLYEVAV